MLIQFIDYGYCEELDIESVKSLPYVNLVTLPPQVVYFSLKQCLHIQYIVFLMLLLIFHCYLKTPMYASHTISLLPT